MSDRLIEIKENIAKGYWLYTTQQDWLISKVEYLTKRCEEAREIFAGQQSMSLESADKKAKWLEGGEP